MAETTAKSVKIDDYVEEVAEEPWSLYWSEHKTDSDDFDRFWRNPKEYLQQQIGVPDDYQVETQVVNHQVGLMVDPVCRITLVMPREKRVLTLLYKH